MVNADVAWRPVSNIDAAYKMSKEHLKFIDVAIEKLRFHSSKIQNPIRINDLDTDEIVISNEFLYTKKAFKCIIGYKNDERVMSLCVLPPEMSGYVRHFDNDKTIFFGKRQIFKKIQ